MLMMERKAEEANPILSNPCRRLLAVLRVPRYEQLIMFILLLSFWNKLTPAQGGALKHGAIQIRYFFSFDIQYKIIKLTIVIPDKFHVYSFQNHPT